MDSVYLLPFLVGGIGLLGAAFVRHLGVRSRVVRLTVAGALVVTIAVVAVLIVTAPQVPSGGPGVPPLGQ